jgi:hypothetical protein
LKAALDAELAARKAAKVSPLRIEDQTICLTSEGEAWQEGRKGYTGFIHMFSEARKAAGIDGVSFGDLRGTAVTRLALAGCTVPEICPSPDTATRTPTASCRPTTCTAIRRSPGTRSANSRPIRSASPPRELQNALQNAHSVLAGGTRFLQ